MKPCVPHHSIAWVFLGCLVFITSCVSHAVTPAETETRYKLQAWLISWESEEEEGETTRLQTVRSFENPLPSLLEKPGAVVTVLIELPLIPEERSEFDRTFSVQPIGSVPGLSPADFTAKVGDQLAATLVRSGDRYLVKDIDFSSSQISHWLSVGEGQFWAPVRTSQGSRSSITLAMNESLVLSFPSHALVFTALEQIFE